MVSHGKPPKIHSYNAWDAGAKTSAEKRGRRQGATPNDRTLKAIEELSSVQTLDEFREICEAQARRREKRGY